ncbi:MAG: hypothetical protein M1827_000476 [Pycnora praestabilis]|nr:MAG: hypothetical protein M1827_000476 [Pycnora praestabilis]
MFNFRSTTTTTTSSSTSPSSVRSRSPDRSPCTNAPYNISSADFHCEQVKNIVLPPPPVLAPYSACTWASSNAGEEPPSRQSLHPKRSLTKEFYEKCKLPPLTISDLPGGASSNLALRSPQHSPQRSPTKEKSEFMATLTGDKNGQIKIEEKSSKIAGWFSGNSAPVSLGVVSVKEEDEEESSDNSQFPERPAAPTPTSINPSTLTRPANKRKSTVQSMASTSRFSLFGIKPSAAERETIPIPADDEFFNFDISTALFPAGPADPFSPSSFKNLLVNAEGLLLRLQTAYKVRTKTLEEMTAEKSAQQEELEEAETRSRHLKIQLDDMAEKFANQEKAMMDLVDELAQEKQRRREEEEARHKSIALVKRPDFDVEDVVEDDDDTSQRNVAKKRESKGTLSSDSGFESEGESSADSVFSRATETPISRSGTISSRTSGADSPELFQTPKLPQFPSATTTAMSATRVRPSLPPQRSSTFQNVLKGISINTADDGFGEEPRRWGCANCEGGNAANAWGVVGTLRDENRGLKERVVCLEGAIEGCLDLVGGGFRI